MQHITAKIKKMIRAILVPSFLCTTGYFQYTRKTDHIKQIATFVYDKHGNFTVTQKRPDKKQASQPVILSSHCFRRTINPPMNIHSILYAIFYVNLDLTQFSFKNIISFVCSCTLRISFIFIYTQHIFNIICHFLRHLKLLRNTGMPRRSHTVSAEQKM